QEVLEQQDLDLLAGETLQVTLQLFRVEAVAQIVPLAPPVLPATLFGQIKSRGEVVDGLPATANVVDPVRVGARSRVAKDDDDLRVGNCLLDAAGRHGAIEIRGRALANHWLVGHAGE